MARVRPRVDRGMMSVNPHYSVSAALGGYRTAPFTRAIEIAGNLLAAAAVEVSGIFTPQEWRTLADAYQPRAITPAQPSPGIILSHLVQQAQNLQRPRVQIADLGPRLLALTYLQGWAVVIACQFYHDYQDRLQEGDRWWELECRDAYARPGASQEPL